MERSSSQRYLFISIIEKKLHIQSHLTSHQRRYVLASAPVRWAPTVDHPFGFENSLQNVTKARRYKQRKNIGERWRTLKNLLHTHYIIICINLANSSSSRAQIVTFCGKRPLFTRSRDVNVVSRLVHEISFSGNIFLHFFPFFFSRDAEKGNPKLLHIFWISIEKIVPANDWHRVSSRGDARQTEFITCAADIAESSAHASSIGRPG